MRLLLSILAGLALAATATAADKPNVIVFLSDDVGYGEYGFQGNAEGRLGQVELEEHRPAVGPRQEEGQERRRGR
jgi:hypothetical protein